MYGICYYSESVLDKVFRYKCFNKYKKYTSLGVLQHDLLYPTYFYKIPSRCTTKKEIRECLQFRIDILKTELKKCK